MKIFKSIFKFFDKIEDKVRGRLSKHPIIYALIGSIGIVLVWRGVWMIADDLGMSGTLSFVLGVAVLLIIGLFVSFFVGEQIIISGIKSEKRTDEKTVEEIKYEAISLFKIEEDINVIKSQIADVSEQIKKSK